MKVIIKAKAELIRFVNHACNFLERLRAHHVVSRNYRGATSPHTRLQSLGCNCAHIRVVHGIVIGS